MKKMISLLLITVLLFATVIPASASDFGETTSIASGFNEGRIDGEPVDLQSTSIPTQFHDLNSKYYQATLVTVGFARLYTNSYFYPSADGKIRVNFTVYTKPAKSNAFSGYKDNDAKFTVGIYDITANKYVGTQQFYVPANQKPYVNSKTFSGLTQSHKYAVYFMCIGANPYHSAIIAGGAIISH